MTSLKKSLKIHTLAADLGLKPSPDPVTDIIGFCEVTARKVLREFPKCSRPAELLEILAERLHTKFEIVDTEQQLFTVQQKYLELGERAFATLRMELRPDVYGITFRRQAKKPWEHDYISVIDARGDKAYRANYTKWHELGHLFILTDQLRLTFTRTSCTQDLKDPEESLVDVIAGRFAFWPPLFSGKIEGTISFENIENTRMRLCPEASKASALLGLVKVWPLPCALLEARLEFKKGERSEQRRFTFRDAPKPALRVVNVTVNEPAQSMGLRVHRQWRVPKRSIIYQVFENGQARANAVEDLSWWETSTGSSLDPLPVSVEVRRNGETVQAIVTPAP